MQIMYDVVSFSLLMYYRIWLYLGSPRAFARLLFVSQTENL